jgi:putative molybdopterin biosynthesis protein
MLLNSVRRYREQAGWSQAELARRVGVTRQSIRLIELGDTVPSTLVALRLAQLFNVRVEQLFHDSAQAEGPVVAAADPDLQQGDRVILSEVNGHQSAHRLPLIGSPSGVTGLVSKVEDVTADGQVRVALSPYRQIAFGAAIAGCDPALQLLTGPASAQTTHYPLFWRNADNAQSLRLLQSGFVHAVAVHTPMKSDAAASQWTKLSTQVTRVHFATWQLGWVVRQGNPLGFTGPADLASGRFRLVNRPLGAGTRALLDNLLQSANVRPAAIPQYDYVVDSHIEAALAVQSGVADVAIVVSAVSTPLRLDFIPVHVERCELWVPQRNMEHPAVQSILSDLSTDAFRWDLAAFGDYDVSQTGQLVSG